MEIHIRLDQHEPPTGSVRTSLEGDTDDEAISSLRFCGWLGLLRVLDEVFHANDGDPGYGPARETGI